MYLCQSEHAVSFLFLRDGRWPRSPGLLVGVLEGTVGGVLFLAAAFASVLPGRELNDGERTHIAPDLLVV